jgi:hypothetical protein
MAVPAGKGDRAVLATSQWPHDEFSKIEVYGQLNNGRAFRLKKKGASRLQSRPFWRLQLT